MSKKASLPIYRTAVSANARRSDEGGRARVRGVLLAIRNEILREGLRSMISECGFRVASYLGSLQEFTADARVMQRSQIVVIDGSEERDAACMTSVVGQIRAFDRRVHIIILIPPHFAGVFDQSVLVSASAIVTTDITARLLVNLLQLVSGNYVIRATNFFALPEPKEAPLKEKLQIQAQEVTANPVIDKMFLELSARERQILVYVARGASNKVIARALGISEATVKIHVKGIFRKIGVSNRTQAAFHVFRRGWLVDEHSLIQPGPSPVPPANNCVPIDNAIILPRTASR